MTLQNVFMTIGCGASCMALVIILATIWVSGQITRHMPDEVGLMEDNWHGD